MTQEKRRQRQERVSKVGTERFHRLAQLLYKHDLESLVPCGVPADEYEAEALMVLERMQDEKDVTPTVMHRVLADVFAHMFSPPGREEERRNKNQANEKFRAAAQDIVEHLW